jgi:hypothetical protein
MFCIVYLIFNNIPDKWIGYSIVEIKNIFT